MLIEQAYESVVTFLSIEKCKPLQTLQRNPGSRHMDLAKLQQCKNVYLARLLTEERP